MTRDLHNKSPRVLLFVATWTLVILPSHSAHSQNIVLQLPPENKRMITAQLGRGLVGKALPSKTIEDVSVYFPLRETALIYEVVGGPNAGKTQTLDLAKVTRPDGRLAWRFQLSPTLASFIRPTPEGDLMMPAVSDVGQGVVVITTPANPFMLKGMKPGPGEEEGGCPRCGTKSEFRKPGSTQRAWAFLIAAAVCYVPANVLPVLTTTTAAGTSSDTILQGVVLLWSPTGWPLSLIVLVASIMIPSAKILALGYLLIAAQRGTVANNEQRTRLYRIVEFIGRWSMVDVFVDTFTAALVQLQPLMSVEPGPGLVFFAAVVVLTMLAVESFDPRLIWDAASAMEAQYA